MNALIEIRSFVLNNNKISEDSKDLIIRKIDTLISDEASKIDPYAVFMSKIPDRIEERDGQLHAIYKSAI